MNKKKNVYISGAFDILHVGHLDILEFAKSLGDTLIVGVNTDEMVKIYKRPEPISPYSHRKRIVASLKCIDRVIPHTALDEIEMLDKYRIDIVVVGPEWGEIKGQEIRKKYCEIKNIKIVVYPHPMKKISTTKLIRRVQGKW